MNESNDKVNQKHQTLFMHLVMMMSSSALQHMGKTVNPMTGKTEIDLDGAAFAIDMLEMIEARTEGNLERDEDRLLKTQLANLRLNYVETRSSAGSPVDTQSKGTEASSQATASSGASAETGATQDTDKKPEPSTGGPEEAGASSEAAKPKDDASSGARFHKSYG